jgi:hypothetical protein
MYGRFGMHTDDVRQVIADPQELNILKREFNVLEEIELGYLTLVLKLEKNWEAEKKKSYNTNLPKKARILQWKIIERKRINYNRKIRKRSKSCSRQGSWLYR